MNFNRSALAAMAVMALSFTAANAATVQVTPSNPQGWSSPAGENTGGGYATITGTAPYDGNGSLELGGDRVRYVLGSLYDNPNAAGATNNLGTVSSLSNLSFSYMIDPTATTGSHDPLYSPALRMVFWNGNTKDEFVFEQAYQVGGYASAQPRGTWNTTTSDSLFWLKSSDDVNTDHTIAEWAALLNVADATVGGIYIGVGSSASLGYHAYADNVVAGANTYKFDLSARGGAVPEPASWTLMIVGFGAAGSMLRRRRVLAA